MENDNINMNRVLDIFFKLSTKDVDFLTDNLMAIKAALLFKGIDFGDGKLDKASLSIADGVVNATKETLSDIEEYLKNKGGDFNAKS